MAARQEIESAELLARPSSQTRHEILGGKVQLFLRSRSPFWQCEASIDGRQFRKSTGQESLSQAKDVAEDWYVNLKGQAKWGGGLPTAKPKGKLFREAAAKFIEEYEVLTEGERTGERILEIEVRGKRGVGFCKSMPGAVRPFERLRDRLRAAPEERSGATRDRRGATEIRRGWGTTPRRDRGHGGISRGHGSQMVKPAPTDHLFGPTQRDLMNIVLGELGLKFDRDGQRRTSYSLRHTYICFRLMEGADIYQVAKNCRTSVEMIEKYYAAHIKNMLDASAINVRRLRSKSANALGTLTAEQEDQAA